MEREACLERSFNLDFLTFLSKQSPIDPLLLISLLSVGLNLGGMNNDPDLVRGPPYKASLNGSLIGA
jgi:hypothetical protein